MKCCGGRGSKILSWPRKVLLRKWLLSKELKEWKECAMSVSEGKAFQIESTASTGGCLECLRNSEKFSMVGKE